MRRHDYAFPFRIDPASGQGRQAGYETHVRQMIAQILLTAPGERADLPEFGCGLRQLVFAPLSDALSATTQILVQTALNRWLSDQITVQKVTVSRPADSPALGELLIRIEYTLIEDLSTRQTEVRIL